MGVDITGWVEVKPIYFDPTATADPIVPILGRWVPIIHNVGFLVGRDYDTFGCLFGARNHANFIPLAAERGIPR
jgi:hypothetical protein